MAIHYIYVFVLVQTKTNLPIGVIKAYSIRFSCSKNCRIENVIGKLKMLDILIVYIYFASKDLRARLYTILEIWQHPALLLGVKQRCHIIISIPWYMASRLDIVVEFQKQLKIQFDSFFVGTKGPI